MDRHCLERVPALKDYVSTRRKLQQFAAYCLTRHTHAEKRGAGPEGERYSLAVRPLPKL